MLSNQVCTSRVLGLVQLTMGFLGFLSIHFEDKLLVLCFSVSLRDVSFKTSMMRSVLHGRILFCFIPIYLGFVILEVMSYRL